MCNGSPPRLFPDSLTYRAQRQRESGATPYLSLTRVQHDQRQQPHHRYMIDVQATFTLHGNNSVHTNGYDTYIHNKKAFQ